MSSLYRDWRVYRGYGPYKILYSRDGVMALYVVNALMVAADIVLYYRNTLRRETVSTASALKTP